MDSVAGTIATEWLHLVAGREVRSEEGKWIERALCLPPVGGRSNIQISHVVKVRIEKIYKFCISFIRRLSVTVSACYSLVCRIGGIEITNHRCIMPA